MKKETDVNTRSAVSKIHRKLNHKRIEQMDFAYRNAGKLDEGIRKRIHEIVNK